MRSDWHFGVNDPDPLDWLIFLAYMVTACLCWRVWRRSERRSERGAMVEQLLWGGLALLTFLLGINKQLDLQTPFLALGRAVSMAGGWYRQRRVAEWIFAGSLSVGGVAVLAWIAWWAGRRWSRYVLPLSGVAFLVAFVVMETAPSRHHGRKGLPEPLIERGQVFEMIGIAFIASAAARQLTRRKTPSDNAG